MLSRIALPRTDLEVSRICLGTASFGVKLTEPECHRLMDRYLELGGNCLDTARVYSDWVPGEKGRCERIIGEWLRAKPGRRDRLVIATKGGAYEWNTPSGIDPTANRVTPDHVRRDLERSLGVLGVDTIDLYYLHRDSRDLPPEEIVDFMQAFVEEGKVRYLGVANWTADRIAAANAHAKRTGQHGFVANQPNFSLGAWNAKPVADRTLHTLDKAGYDFHRQSGLALLPYSSQALGYFSKALGDNAADPAALADHRYHTAGNQRVAKAVRTLAEAKGCNANGIVMAYLIQQPFPVVPLVGCYRIDQLEDSARAAAVTLTSDELQALEDAAESGVRH